MPTSTTVPAITPRRLGLIRARLLDWYEAHQQPFPWRDARDPYAAMVAAVAAQQTQMPRVLEIYERWMAAYPTLEALARADRADGDVEQHEVFVDALAGRLDDARAGG